MGALRKVDVWNVTVYVDPPNAPEPGIYVAADFEAAYENSVVCGYLVWHDGPDEAFRIMRQDSGELQASVESELSDAERNRIRREFRCRPQPVPE